MKVKRVTANNRKKCFQIETRKGVYEFPYSSLTVKPSSRDPLMSVKPDPEIGNEGLVYRLRSGAEDTVHIEQVLEYAGDYQYLCEQLLYKLTLEAQKLIKKSGLSKRELSRKLKTSPTQLYRLLDQSFYGKTIDQMVKLLHALGKSVDLVFKEAA